MVSLGTAWQTRACARRARGGSGAGLLACTPSILALACGGIVENHRSTSGSTPALGTGGAVSSVVDPGGGSAGAVVSGGVAGDAATGAPGLATGGATGTGGSAFSQDAGAGCHETNDRARIEVQQGPADGGTSLADGGTSGSVDQSLTGIIRSVDRSSFVLARCDPGACDGLVWTVTIEAPGLDLRGTLWPRISARVHYARVPRYPGADGFAMTTEILVTNPDIASDPSATTVESLYVAADVDGEVIREAPYTVSYLDAPCPVTADCAGQLPDVWFDRALTVSIPMGSAGTLEAAMGQAGKLFGTNGRLTLRNLRSVETDSCDGRSNLDTSYWITNQLYRE